MREGTGFLKTMSTTGVRATRLTIASHTVRDSPVVESWFHPDYICRSVAFPLQVQEVQVALVLGEVPLMIRSLEKPVTSYP